MYIAKLGRRTTYTDFDLAGTPTRSGTFPFQMTVLSGSRTQTQDFTFTVMEDGLSIVPLTLRMPRVGAIYSETLSVNSSITRTVLWNVSEGTLPPGMLLREVTGELTGTPTTAGTYTFTITASDGSGRRGTQTYSLVIEGTEAPGVRILAHDALTNGRVGQAYPEQTYRAEGGNGAYAWSLSGNTPPGLSLDPLTGVLRGTPTTAGTYNFYINANGFNMPGVRDQLAVQLIVKARLGTGSAETESAMPTSMTPDEARQKEVVAKQTELTPRQKALWQTFERRWTTVRSRIHSTVARASTNLNKAPFNTLQQSKQIADFTLSLEDLNDEIASYQLLSQAEMQARIQQADKRMTNLGLLIRDTSKTWTTRDKTTALQIRNDLINTRSSLNLALQAFITFRRATPLQK